MWKRHRVSLGLPAVLFAAAVLLLVSLDAVAKGGASTEVTGFRVEITGAGSGADPDSAWETCSGGALCIEIADSSTGSDQTPIRRKSVKALHLQGPLPAPRGAKENTYEILENGAGRFKVEIDGAPVARAGVESISVEDLVIDEREVTTGADWDYRLFEPGDPHFGSITIRSRVGKDSKELYQWWLDTSRGKNIRKDISVVCLKRDGGEARRFDFHGCEPTCYAPFAFGAGGVATDAITLRCGGVSLTSTGGRKALCEWITEVVQGKAWKRALTIQGLTKKGEAAGSANEFLDCFPTRYVFPAWDASSEGPLHEAVAVKPQRVEVR